MQTFIEILKLIAVSLAPGALGLIIYIVDNKYSKIKNFNKYIKGIIIGFLFTMMAMLPFYVGMDYTKIFDFEYQLKGNFGPILASPIIASIIFGYVAGLTTGIIGFIWRFFVVNLSVVDYLRFADSFSILVASLIGILILKLIIKKKTTPKWTYGIVLGLIVECVHLILAFIIITVRYKDIDFAHQIINETDFILFLSTIFSISLAFLWLNIYNKQKIRVFVKETKLHSSIQRRLTLFFLLAFFITISTTLITSGVKSYADAQSDLLVADEDVVCEIKDTADDYGFNRTLVIEEIVSNRRIRTNGFIVIANAKDQQLYRPDNQINDEKPEVLDNYQKDQIMGTPNRLFSYIHNKLYLDDNPNNTIDKYISGSITFKDRDKKDIVCQRTNLLNCKIFDESKNSYVRFLILGLKCSTKKDGGNEYYVCSFLSVDEATDSVVLSIRISMYFEILVYSIVYLLIYKLIKNKVVDNIDSINNSLSRISDGKLNTKVNVRDYDEFSSLSDDINQTVDVLKGYIKDANKRIDDELKYAKTIQMNSLPLVFPSNPKFDLYASMITAKQVGGDFYDFFFIDDTHLFFLMADVSGKGIPAAMFMMRAKTLVGALAETKELSLDQIIDNVNDELNVDNKAGMFVTAFAAILDLTTGRLDYVNAGHTRPLIKNNKGQVSYLNAKPNMVLGVFSGFKYTLETTYLKHGDQILLYTDGVTEATNKKKVLYGEDRLMKLFTNNKFNSSRDSIDRLNKELAKFQKGVEQADDITIFSLIYISKRK